MDPRAAWKFFAQEGFDMGWIDGGASRTWYLVFAGGECALSFFLGGEGEKGANGVVALGGI